MYSFSIHRHTGKSHRISGHDEEDLATRQYGRSSGFKAADTRIFTFSSLFMTIECSTTYPDDTTDGTLAQLMAWL